MLFRSFVMVNQQEFTKTANCWGVRNNAKGTNTNRIVVLRRGAKSVKNLLQVVPKPQREAVSDSDDVIADNVKKAFDADATVDASGISVASVNKGVVLLSGAAKSIDAHLKAVEVASKVPGVRRVASEVKVEGTN